MELKARDALPLYKEGGREAAAAINKYMSADYTKLGELWHKKFPDEYLGRLGQHIQFGMDCDYHDIIETDLPELDKRAEAHLLAAAIVEPEQEGIRFKELLHPIIVENSYQLYQNGHLREAVLNSITAIFDFIRARTGSHEDGDRLIGQVMAPNSPRLILSELGTDSGKNEQKGFMQIYKGAYQGIRNPKAHSLAQDLTPEKAAQYLVFASLLARRIEEAEVVDA